MTIVEVVSAVYVLGFFVIMGAGYYASLKHDWKVRDEVSFAILIPFWPLALVMFVPILISERLYARRVQIEHKKYHVDMFELEHKALLWREGYYTGRGEE